MSNPASTLDSRATRRAIGLLFTVAFLPFLAGRSLAQGSAAPAPAPPPSPPPPIPPTPPVGPSPWVPPNPRNLTAKEDLEPILRRAQNPKRALETYRVDLELFRQELEGSRKSGSLLLPEYKKSMEQYRIGIESYRGLSDSISKK